MLKKSERQALIVFIKLYCSTFYIHTSIPLSLSLSHKHTHAHTHIHTHTHTHIDTHTRTHTFTLARGTHNTHRNQATTYSHSLTLLFDLTIKDVVV